jgi:predicted nucleic acid-binding protein
MLNDIVVDTNILLHAQNPEEARFAAANEFISKMFTVSTLLCVDNGFDLDESANKSHIGHEYLSKLSFGSTGFSLISYLASNCRFNFLPKRASQQTSRRINQLVRKPSDRIFLNVAFNSEDKVLISHDYEDFQVNKRTTIQRDLHIDIIEALDGVNRL